MELLRDMAGRGYPRDYLLARIKGRRRYLVGDWRALLAAPDPLSAIAVTPYRQGPVPGAEEVIWSGLLRESAWLYAQMEEEVRSILAPLFLYFELRTVLLCLRQRQAGEGRNCEELLRFTLLSTQVQRVLQAENDTPTAVSDLSSLFARLAQPFKGLRQAYRKQGVAGFEERLATVYLEHVAHSRLNPVLGEFFSRLIDVRNAITLAKYRRWRITAPPSFIRGGTIKESLLREAAQQGDGSLGGAIILRLAGGEAAPAADNLESLLLARLTRLVRSRGREPDGIGCILDYLWRLAMEARNLSLLVHGAEIDRDLLGGELIR
jgi:vacuolar-type H+-ATPase subunit C/Vma6